MPDVLHKTRDPVDYRPSQDETKLADPADWFIGVDISQVRNVHVKYWKRPLANPVQEMTQPEKDAVDAKELADQRTANRSEAVGEIDAVGGRGVELRALVELFNKRDNYLVNRITELQTALDAIKGSTGPADAIRAAIPASWSATDTRTKADAITQYKADINAGNQDIP